MADDALGGFKSLASTESLRILLVIGLATAAWFGWSWWSEQQLILRASEVSAEILASSVETYSVGSGSNRESRWRPVVRYRYRVNERTYESSSVTPLNKSDDRPWAEEIAARFHAGDTVTAWLDPEDVEHSFLLPISSWKEPAGFGLGVTMILVTGFVLLRRRAARMTSDD